MPVQRVVRDAFRLYASKNNSEFNLGLIYHNMVGLAKGWMPMHVARGWALVWRVTVLGVRDNGHSSPDMPH